MTGGVRIRLIAFAVLAAVGVVYVAASYLGLMDKVLGRGLTVYATLPTSGGLFEGSEVTYRGVKIGTVGTMQVTPTGLRAQLDIKDGVQIPQHSQIHVHNLSAVGEQYLDIVPADARGPYLANGDTLAGSSASLPIDEGALLVDLNRFVSSVDKRHLQVTVHELGAMFRGTGHPLGQMLDGGQKLMAGAVANEDATFRLLDNGRVVMRTQAANAANILSFSRSLRQLTHTVAARDPQLRQIFEGGGATATEIKALMSDLQPTMPVFIGDLVTLNQIATVRIPAIETLLVEFPVMISTGFLGTPGDGYGHINLQFANSPPACTKGYLPSNRWRPSTDLSPAPIFPARCLEGPPANMRGNKYAPSFPGSPNRVSAYDPRTGIGGDASVGLLQLGSQGGQLTAFGDSAWQWMLIGPQESQ